MNAGARNQLRALGAIALGLLLSVVVAYWISELHVLWSMRARGLSERAELSEDYGFAFDNLVVTATAWFVALCVCTAWAWRWLGRALRGV